MPVIAPGLCQCGCGKRTGLATVTRTDRGHVRGEPLPFFHKHNRRRLPLDPEGLRICQLCREAKDPHSFVTNRTSSDGLGRRCRICNRRMSREWRRENPGRVQANFYRWRMQKQFGISPAEIEAMKKRQEGRCAACGKEPKPQRNRDGSVKATFMVDHCHRTNRVRALLCHGCNTALGLLDENPDRIEKLARYARTHCR